MPWNYSTVTDCVMDIRIWSARIPRDRPHRSSSTYLSQVPREVNVHTVHDRQVVGQQLQGEDVEQSLETVDSQRNTDGSVFVADGGVIVVANDDCDAKQIRSATYKASVRAAHHSLG